MAVKFRDYEAFILELDRVAAAEPQKYREKVKRLAILGHVFAFGILVVLVLTLIAFIPLFFFILQAQQNATFVNPLNVIRLVAGGILLISSLVASVGTTIEALRVKPMLPEGSELTRAIAPELF